MSLTISYPSYPFQKKKHPCGPDHAKNRLLGRLSPSNFSCIESDCEAPEVIYAASRLKAIVIVAGVLSYKNPMPGNTSFGSGLPPWSKTTLVTIVLKIGFLEIHESQHGSWTFHQGNVEAFRSSARLGTEDDGFWSKNDAPFTGVGIDNEACRSSWNDG